MAEKTLLVKWRLGTIACKPYSRALESMSLKLMIFSPDSAGKMKNMTRAKNLRITWPVLCAGIIVSFSCLDIPIYSLGEN